MDGITSFGDKNHGYRTNNSKSFEIKDLSYDKGAYGQGYKVTNTSGKDYFIPTRTKAEWDAFKAHRPSGVELKDISNFSNTFFLGNYSSDQNWREYCIIKNTKLFCWPKNQNTTDNKIPDSFNNIIYYTHNSAGMWQGYGRCVINDNDSLYCVGANIPQSWNNNVKYVSVARGIGSICIVNKSDKIECTGSVAPSIPNGWDREIKQIEQGYKKYCILKKNGNLKCSGPGVDNRNWTWCYYSKQVDIRHNGSPAGTYLNIPAGWDSNIKKISMHDNTVCAIKENGSLRCWGCSSVGSTSIPTGWNSDIKDVIVDNSSVCAIKNNKSLKCWGNNSHGQSNVPSDFATNIKNVYKGDFLTCAEKTNGDIKCWGLEASDFPF